MLKVVEVDDADTQFSEYPYQLVDWQEMKMNLDEAENNFIEHGCEKRAIIIHSPSGWAIFTDGKDLNKEDTDGTSLLHQMQGKTRSN